MSSRYLTFQVHVFILFRIPVWESVPQSINLFLEQTFSTHSFFYTRGGKGVASTTELFCNNLATF